MTIPSLFKNVDLTKLFASFAVWRMACTCCIVMIFSGWPATVKAQCVGLPSVTSLGSNKFPVGLCAPVQANVTYTVAFAVPVGPGQLELIYDWGDGSAPEIVPLTPGSKSYNASRNHLYPAESDCEYFVTMAIRYKGKICTNTNQIQKISSWRTDEHNGGNIDLISPTTKTNVHLVCEGEDISVVFDDKTNWNCNGQYETSSLDPIESPNTEYRWQQIVYNTPVEGSKIPNISVNGVALTAGDGSDIVTGYQDPRGVFYMSAPVLVNDSRRRPSLQITAPGGFGPGTPKAGDVFAVTLRYWNFCNPYDDPEIPGPPVDVINGDHAPVEKRALISVLAPPPALTATEEAVCLGTTPSAFSVSGVATGNVVNWYRYNPGSDEPGELIASGKDSTLPIVSHPDWTNNTTAGSFKVWATQRANTSDATNCESPKTLVTRIIRQEPQVPRPIVAPPTSICNGETFSIVLPAPAREQAGGRTKYTWSVDDGLSLVSATDSTARFAVNVTDFGSALFADRNITVNRQYVAGPVCSQSETFAVRIFRTPNGGSVHAGDAVCETDSLGDVVLSGYTGAIARWEVKKDDGNFVPYDGAASGDTIFPGKLKPGHYSFRAVVTNGPCKEVYSIEKNVVVSANPSAAYAGDDQFICSALQSAALNANFPDIGSAQWTYVSSVPADLPQPSFDARDPNTIVMISAENAGVYTLRWTVTNGSCVSYDDVVIDFGTNPSDPDAGDNRQVCGVTTELTGNVPVKGLGSWTVVSGPGCVGADCPVVIKDRAVPQTLITLDGSAPRYGAYTFRWNISSGGNNCFLKTDDVTITFEAPVIVTASDINNVCLESINPQPIELTGTITGPVFSAAWTNVSGRGTVTASSILAENGIVIVTAFYQPDAEDYLSGLPATVKLSATPARASCSVAERTIAINFNRRPVADGGANIDNLCDDQVQLHAKAPRYGVGRWTASLEDVVFDDATDPETMIRNLPIGSTQVTWTVSDAGNACPSQSSTFTITRVPLPEVQDIDITECAIEPGFTRVVLADYEDSVTAIPAADREINWFKWGASGHEPISGTDLVQERVADGQRYVARVRDRHTDCASDAIVTVRARPLPVVMNTVISECESVTGSNMITGLDLSDARFATAITQSTNVDVSWYASEADALADRFRITVPVVVDHQKEFFAKVSWKEEPFCFSIARLNMMVTPQPAITGIAGRESVCQASSSSMSNDLPVHVYQVMPIAGAHYYWEIPDGPDEFAVFGGGGERDFYVLLQFPNVYTGKIRVGAEVNGCSGPVVEKEIAVSAAPAKPFIQGSSVVCENNNHVAFSVTPDNFPSSAYNWEIRKVSDNTVGGAFITEGQLTGNILVNFGAEDVIISVRENNAECVSPVATKVIKVMDPPEASLSVEEAPSCLMAADGVIKTDVSGGTAPFSGFEIVETGQKDEEDDGLFRGLTQGSYSVRFSDANGCLATTNVINLAATEVPFEVDFGIEATPTGCDGGDYAFAWEAQAGIDYRWEWGDGTSMTVPGTSIEPGTNHVTHRYAPLSTVSATTYSVRLFGSYDGCAERVKTRLIELEPAIRLSVLTGDTVLCSGETITFYDNSSGVDEGRWFYRLPGGTALSQSSSAREGNPSFTLNNTTSRNPIVYEVVYEAQNIAGCQAVYTQQVVVYRANDAAFEVSEVPSFDAGSVTVEIENTSSVIDGNQFRYTWNYGAQGVAKDPSDTAPYDITYYSPGKKEISLSVVNVAALAAHKLCQTVYRETIDIPAREVRAAFSATPFAACFPVTIAVQNTSAGADMFLWKVLREGAVVTTSNLQHPEFRITEPGVYDITLTATIAATGEQAESIVRGLQVYGAPDAAFGIRSDRLYVPDQVMEVFNFSRGADLYEWHFGDGYASDAFEPTHSYENEGRYSVVLFSGRDHGAVDVDGDGRPDRNLVCYDSARAQVVALQGGDIQIPNAFTPDVGGPNGGIATAEGFNDVFLPVVKGAASYHMQIYDRWGTVVFETRDKNIGWDGYDRNQRLLPAGVYIYKIELVQSNGETITRAGDVSLIR